jgi:organic hydroperoxide reductase OsmC/OhrA
LELSRSEIGKQCEVLLINVEQRTNIIDLVNNMNNLRALIVRCREDIELGQRREKLVQWLQQYLPSTCTISNSIENNNEVRSWIR